MTPRDLEELRFEGLGGPNTLLLARATAPSTAHTRTQVLIAPALGLRASYYRAVAEALAHSGLDTAIVEWPGHGSSPVRASRSHDWGYAELGQHLAGARACTALPEHDRVVWLGHSIGGQVAMMDAGSGDVSGVVLVASGTPWRGAWDGGARVPITLASLVFPVVGALVGHHPGQSLRFGGREARTLMRQWSHLARTGDYPRDAEAALAACSAPILAVRIEGDDWAPERAVEHGLGKTHSARVERHVWRGLPPANVHNKWPRLPGLPLERIAAFIAGL